MRGGVRSGAPSVDALEGDSLDAWRRLLEHAPRGFAVTRGPAHELVFVNDAFLAALGPASHVSAGESLTGAGVRCQGLVEVLDRTLDEGIARRDERVRVPGEETPTWTCDVWPTRSRERGADGLVIELSRFQPEEPAFALQREIAERMLLGALREQESAEVARSSQRRSAFLAEESGRLGDSIDESATLRSVSRLRLPEVAAWCIVDVVEEDGGARRLAVVHPDPIKQTVLRELLRDSSPHPDDPFGVEAVRHASGFVHLLEGGRAALGLESGAGDPEANIRVGSLLTVPMKSQGRLLGAITFVGEKAGRPYTPEEADLAQSLASRSAAALENARLHAEAVELRAVAQHASRAKSEFVGNVSHELRTPLNAIGGFVDLIAMGVYGPVNTDQRDALQRVTTNQKQLLSLISDLLSFMQSQSGKLSYHTREFPARAFLLEVLEMVLPSVADNALVSGGVECADTLVLRADPDRTTQILLNLLGNAIKFTSPGGRIQIACDADDDEIRIHVIDSGVGIPPDRLADIFEPFVQVGRRLSDARRGVGLGLAISRDLARAMGGNLTAESTVGEGSRFTLHLPRGATGERTGAV